MDWGLPEGAVSGCKAPFQAEGSFTFGDASNVELLVKVLDQVTVGRNQYNGTTGQGGSTSLSDVTGAFYFSDPGNLELMVKLIDFKDRIAVFYGTLSDLEYTLRVEDTVTGQVKTYTNPAGKFCGGLDNQGF